MTGDRAADVLVYALLLILPLSALIARRPRLGQTLKSLAIWAMIFAVGLLVVKQRDSLGHLGGLLTDQSVEGRETRIHMASDGHFWADVQINGVARHMLIDSGATTTAISQATAEAARLDLNASPFPVLLNTANGQIAAKASSADSFVVGGASTKKLGVVVSPAFGETDVIGMNFLSRLASWRVEGRTLILVPKPDKSFT